MEQALGGGDTAGLIDRSRVLEVKPLRSLVPIFPSQSNSTSFTSPFGPFPSGTTPFYPFFSTPVSQEPPGHFPHTTSRTPFHFDTPVSDAVPINSFRAESRPSKSRGVNGNSTLKPSRRSSRRSSKAQYQDHDSDSNRVLLFDDEDAGMVEGEKTRSRKNPATDLEIDRVLSSFNLMKLDSAAVNDGDKDIVDYVLLIFDLLRRKIAQAEDSKGSLRRPDLRAGAILMTRSTRTNNVKRIGPAPGVEVGDIFFFRFELCLIGVHSQSMGGIDYFKLAIEDEPVAISIVSSGGYEDDAENGNELIYSGQGGNLNVDQKLERGNLALKNSFDKGNEVRVVRGVKDIATPTGRIYVYDGVYKVDESWVEKGKSGCKVFKYKLIRLPGQPEAFMTWKWIQQWKDGTASRIGLILPDLAASAENLPVSLVNDIDGSRECPSCFTYAPTIKYLHPMISSEPSSGCGCVGGCLPGSGNCYCIQKNGGYLPYIANGVNANVQGLIYECGPSCACPPNCRNRVSQGGLRVRLEVFKTKDKGWGLRSWDPIRGGAFICEYAGEAIDNSKIHHEMDDYFFDATRTPVPILSGVSNELSDLPFPLGISAKNIGNVARFMNHSCSPNVFWQPVVRSNNQEVDVHVVFHAIRHIPPMTELTYDYGMSPPGKMDKKKSLCFCESSKCKGFFY